MFRATATSLLLMLAVNPWLGTTHPCSGGSPNAIYMLTNERQNSVAAVAIGRNGQLSAGTVTSTGGAGSNSIDGQTNKSAQPDPLVGQSAVAVAGQNVFAVNAGSNSLSMFVVDKADPTKLTLVGQPMPVQGEFPNTVAVSMKRRMACVGTTGAENGVSCASFSKQGLGPFDGLRSFGLKQSTPPVGPTNTLSQLFFSGDASMLFATVKGDPAANNTGFFSAFAVQQTRTGAILAAHDTRSSPEGTAVLFGSALVPGTANMFATDASFGAAVLSVDPRSGEATLVAKQALDDQKATCWATISEMTGSAFVTDVAIGRVVEMSVEDASVIGITDLSGAGSNCVIDLAAAGGAVYALSPGNVTTGAMVMVLDVSGGQGSAKLAQQFDLSHLGVGINAQGMAVLRR